MSSRGGGGGGRREVFLSAHRCPEVDVLPHHDLDTSSTVHSEEEECNSDWSEEDLSLYFSPSVILPSDDEDSGSESSFRCVDVAVETQVTGLGGEGLKMVPKRQIHLKKNNKTKKVNEEVILQHEPSEGGGANTTVRHRPDLLLRQHSMPTSLHTRPLICSDVDGCGVYRGRVAGVSPGFLTAGQSVAQRRLQKSISLDETKTKMATCIIQSALSKKMQVEKINTETSHLKKTPAALPPGGGKEAGPGVSKAPVHVVRDVRGLVKNTYSLSFSSTPDRFKPAGFKVVGLEDSPPPTYQQAVGVKGRSTSGSVSKVAASFNQSRDRNLRRPITTQTRGGEMTTSRRRGGEVVFSESSPPTSATVGQSERPEVHRAGASLPLSVPPSPSSPRQPRVYQQEPGVSSQSDPSPPQQLQTCFYAPSLQHPHLRKVGYIHTPLNSTQNPHLPQSSSPADPLDQTREAGPPPPGRTTTDCKVGAVTPPTIKIKQQPFLCSFPSSFPAQVRSDFLIDVTGPAVTPGAVFGGPAPCHVMSEPNGRYCFVYPQPQHHSKMLLDPETGQFIQVFLPGASPAPNAMFPVCHVNPAPAVINPTPTMLQTSNVHPTILSVLRFQPALYGAPCPPMTLHTHTSP